MMLFVGILMLYLSGAALLVRVHNGLSWKEMISYSFVIGLGVNTFFMFLCDVVGLGFTQYVLFLPHLHLLFSIMICLLNIIKHINNTSNCLHCP